MPDRANRTERLCDVADLGLPSVAGLQLIGANKTLGPGSLAAWHFGTLSGSHSAVVCGLPRFGFPRGGQGHGQGHGHEHGPDQDGDGHRTTYIPYIALENR